MLRFQSVLEQLPVPDLAGTCALYLRFVRPLLTKEELDATERAVADFLRPGGEGELLQERLLRWSRTPGVDNWLDGFWDDWYLCDDAPLVVNVSPAFVLAGTNRSQVARAARLLAAALSFKDLVDRAELEPDRANGAPLCMREYSRLLSTTRIPGETRDSLERHPESRHVVVVRDNRFFSLESLDEEGRPYAVEELERGLQRIVDEAETAGPPVGVLTTDRRRTWARVRDQLVRGPATARESMRTVESAILVLVLERGPAPPQARSVEGARMSLHGDACGRWFDKSIQLVVAENGVAGICMEHAGFDGSTLLRFAEYLVAHEDWRATGRAAPRPARPPVELVFPFADTVRRAIERSRQAAAELVRRTDLAVLDFPHFGRQALAGLRVSPDAFVQMAFQLTHFTLRGESSSTYESVSTKRFLHGRTEAMRSVSPESVAFVQSLRGSREASQAGPQLLRAAIANHATTVARCRDGRGVDRHLLGLRRMLAPGEEVPDLFADEGYAKLSRSVLSTSALPSTPGVELTCFGPVVEEGFGLSYTIHDDRVCCVVTNFHGLAGAFVAELERSLLEMRALLGEP
jgi:carnitine O-acetyltransferase